MEIMTATGKYTFDMERSILMRVFLLIEQRADEASMMVAPEELHIAVSSR